MIGRINSIQSLGTVDGPGVRYVVFLQGCNLRCCCCHNPETWERNGKEISAQEIVNKLLRFKEYFNNKGGITLSGGEPLLQPLFAKEIFSLCHQNNINTCLDTSGSIINNDVLELLDVTDFCLLDIKYHTEELYRKNVGCSLSSVLSFLECLQQKNINTTLRQVIIPSINDSKENILFLKSLKERFSCVKKLELLPFKKICQAKYDNLKINFPFANMSEPSIKLMEQLNSLL